MRRILECVKNWTPVGTHKLTVVCAHYLHWQPIPTRWKDNDVYGHVNNAVHYSMMDTAINEWMIRVTGFDPGTGDSIGLCVESHCSYKAEAAFPDVINVGMRVGTLGRSSVRWELGLFRPGETLIAEGYFVHVFVDRQTRKPVEIVDPLRSAMQKLVIA